MRQTASSLNDLASVRAYLSRIRAEPRSLRTAAIAGSEGRYTRDRILIRFDWEGTVTAFPDTGDHLPTIDEQKAISREWAEYDWPELKPMHKIMSPPDMIANCPPEDLFIFRNEEGLIVFIQTRIAIERNGEKDKKYVPWTYWSDDLWRMCEAEGPLPLYNAHLLKGASTVFIHEGAKAARAVQEMVEGKTDEAVRKLRAHPWGKELSGAVHLGWIGGALHPGKTDWGQIRKAGVTRAYIVSDNDEPGRRAVPTISRGLNIPTFQVQFTEEFPPGFDLADPFPEKMFGEVEGRTFYVGRGFRDYLHPATWATDMVPPPPGQKGRNRVRLRESFKGMWAYVEEADLFVCTEMPDILRSELILNKMLSPFSDVTDTTKYILRSYEGRSTRICYRPDQEGLLVSYRGSSAINLHVPSNIWAQDGDPRPFLDFMRYMFPNDRERYEVMRWCATIIARPEIRMAYGMLLISERQGVGKTTLGSLILAPLVGDSNVTFPSEMDILSPFNDWVAHKRLAIVSEIYSGASWKAYHALKSVITDKDITVNQKYMRPYIIENWCHIIASSNSMRALKMENDDRRWFYPEVTEYPWPREKFEMLRSWLSSGGLSIIRKWAEGFNHYVTPAERAPMTGRKQEMIEGSRSEAQREAAAVAEGVMLIREPVALLMKDVTEHCRAATHGKMFDTDYELRKAMTDTGMIAYGKRVRIAGRLQYVLMNMALTGMVAEDADPQALIRNYIRKCSDILEGGM